MTISRGGRGTRARLAYDWIDPGTYAHTGYVGIDTLLVSANPRNFSEVPEALSRLGFVHQLVHPMRRYDLQALRNPLGPLTSAQIAGEYQGPIVKEAAERMADYAKPWTSAGNLLGSNTLFAFTDPEMAVLFKMIVCEGN